MPAVFSESTVANSPERFPSSIIRTSIAFMWRYYSSNRPPSVRLRHRKQLVHAMVGLVGFESPKRHSASLQVI